MITHEQYVQEIAALAIGWASAHSALTAEERATLDGIKLVYGAGQAGLRGVTYYQRWAKPGQTETPAPFVEVCAFGQESWAQVAGTTIHELGHVLAGLAAGHSKLWKDACGRLGLRRVLAAGTEYKMAMFAPALREAISRLPLPDEGQPVALPMGLHGKPVKLKACPTGKGTRGGAMGGPGSGSRLRLFECECVPPVKARIGRETFAAHCDCCAAPFHFVK